MLQNFFEKASVLSIGLALIVFGYISIVLIRIGFGFNNIYFYIVGVLLLLFSLTTTILRYKFSVYNHFIELSFDKIKLLGENGTALDLFKKDNVIAIFSNKDNNFFDKSTILYIENALGLSDEEIVLINCKENGNLISYEVTNPKNCNEKRSVSLHWIRKLFPLENKYRTEIVNKLFLYHTEDDSFCE